MGLSDVWSATGLFGNKVTTSSTMKGQKGIYQRVAAGAIGDKLLPAQQAVSSDTSIACRTNVTILEAPK